MRRQIWGIYASLTISCTEATTVDKHLLPYTLLRGIQQIDQRKKRESHEKDQEMPLLRQGVQHTERSEKILLHGMCRSRQAGDKEEKEHPPQ